MNEIEFRYWLIENGVKRKVQGDYISRLKRIERELNHCDIDEQYRSDKCKYLLSLFRKNGVNEDMAKCSEANFPIGKVYMGTYRHALKQYIKYREETIT